MTRSFKATLNIESYGHLRTEPVEPGFLYVPIGRGFLPNTPVRIVDSVI